MISLKRKQSGFTIVELLIVIVVIGILAALVITTFSGIQQKARDSERQTDINAIHGQLEAYYAQFGKYPGLNDLNGTTGATWVKDNLKGLDATALQDPKGKTLTIAGEADNDQYGYIPLPTNCVAAGTECTSYDLEADSESNPDPDDITKKSLN